jgi:hypothetical protein
VVVRGIDEGIDEEERVGVAQHGCEGSLVRRERAIEAQRRASRSPPRRARQLAHGADEGIARVRNRSGVGSDHAGEGPSGVALKRLGAPLHVGLRRRCSRSIGEDYASLHPKLLQELLAAQVPAARRAVEGPEPLTGAKVANEPFVKEHVLQRLKVEATHLLGAICGHVKDTRRERVLGQQRHHSTSRRPSSKNPPGQALTSSPRSFSGILRQMLRDPSLSTSTTETSLGAYRPNTFRHGCPRASRACAA